MARTSTSTTLPPGTFSTGNFIREEDVQSAQELMNYAFANSRHQYLFVISGDTGWGLSGNEAATHALVIPTTSGATIMYRWQMRVEVDETDILIGAIMTCPASNTVVVTFDIGADTTALTSFTSGTNSQESTVLTSSSGTGLLTCTLTVNHTVGSGVCTMGHWYVRGNTTAIPGMPDE